MQVIVIIVISFRWVNHISEIMISRTTFHRLKCFLILDTAPLEVLYGLLTLGVEIDNATLPPPPFLTVELKGSLQYILINLQFRSTTHYNMLYSHSAWMKPSTLIKAVLQHNIAITDLLSHSHCCWHRLSRHAMTTFSSTYHRQIKVQLSFL